MISAQSFGKDSLLQRKVVSFGSVVLLSSYEISSLVALPFTATGKLIIGQKEPYLVIQDNITTLSRFLTKTDAQQSENNHVRTNNNGTKFVAIKKAEKVCTRQEGILASVYAVRRQKYM